MLGRFLNVLQHHRRRQTRRHILVKTFSALSGKAFVGVFSLNCLSFPLYCGYLQITSGLAWENMSLSQPLCDIWATFIQSSYRYNVILILFCRVNRVDMTYKSNIARIHSTFDSACYLAKDVLNFSKGFLRGGTTS